MSDRNQDMPDDATFETITTALRACYGDLDEPDFHKVTEALTSGPYCPLIELLRSSGIEITDTTDLNDDVSVHLVLDRSGNWVGLLLSGVGPYAALLHQDAAGRYVWVTQPGSAPTPLAALVAQAVQGASFALLDRSLVSRRIRMGWYDGSEEVTLYQALFTDTDCIP